MFLFNVGLFFFCSVCRTHGSGHRQVSDVLDFKLLDLLPHGLQELH